MFIKQKYLSCILRKHKSFWSLNRLADFVVNRHANISVREKPTSLGPFYVLLGKRVLREKKKGNLKNENCCNV